VPRKSSERHLTRQTLHTAVISQAIVWLLFALLLDGHVRLRACSLCLLAFWVAAAVLFARSRGRGLRRPERVFLAVGWVPFLTAGIPLLLWYWRGTLK
jgi:hypothetical protein